jgi:hypothetical protein
MYNPTLPSSLLDERLEGDVDFSYLSKMFNNDSLRLGVVLEITDIEDEDNQSGIAPEYKVMTIEQNKEGSISSVEYKNCIRLNALGGIADYMFAKLRTPTDATKVKNSASIKKQEGSIVLIMCLDGNSEKGIILGSLDHPEGTRLSKELGHHLEGEFNGVNWAINKEGALTVTFKSATDSKGKQSDEEAAGANFKIEKDGSVELGSGNVEKIRLDKTNKTASIAAEADVSISSTTKSINVTAGESVNVKATKDLIAAAEGKASITVAQTFDIEAKGAANVKVKELKVESKSMIKMKAQSLVDIEGSSAINLKAPTVGIGPSPSEPALLAFQLIVLGVGNLSAPVVSTAIAGFSTSVTLSS